MELQNFRRLLLSAFLLTLFTLDLYAQGNFVYINNNPGQVSLPAPNSVSAFSVGPTGALTPVPGSPFATGGTGTGAGLFAGDRAAICMVGTRLYVANQGSNNVSGFDINPTTGVLTPVPGSPFATGGLAAGNGMSLDCVPNGQFLIASNGGSFNITIFSIAANGALTPILGSPFPLPVTSTVGGIRVSPDGLFLSVALSSFGADSVAMFSIAASGALTSVPGSPFPSPAGGVAAGVDINCASNLLFVGSANAGGTNVDVFSIGATGALTPIPGSPFNNPGVGSNSNVVLLSPNDQFLFVSNQISNTITVFNVAAGGGLSLVPGSPFANPGGAAPMQMETDQAGTFLYVNNSNGTVSVFSIAGSGSLTPVAGSPFAAGSSARPGIAAYPASVCSTATVVCPGDITVSKYPGQCGANVTFSATTTGGSGTVTCTPPSGSFFLVGTTTVNCSLGATQCSFHVTVNDSFTCPNDITVSNASGQCGANVSFTPTGACGTVICNPPAGSFFPVGTTTVNCSLGATQCSFHVTVNDTEAPVVSCGVATSILWSPDHTLVNVGLSANVMDNCGGSPTITVQVFSDEDDEGTAGDKFSPDAKDIALGTLRLRSERKGNEDGRVYLIVVKAVDAKGNVGFCVQTVVVPHDQSQSSLNSVNAQAAAARAYALSHNGAPPPGHFVIGDGPIIGSIQ